MLAHPLRHSALNPFHTSQTSQPSTGVTAQDLRVANLSMVLRHILTSPGTITRAAIAASTGTTRATISRLVDELVTAGVITESEPTITSTRGRPATCLSPAPNALVALGLEVAVDSLKAHLIDLTGQTLAALHTPRPSTHSPAASLRALRQLAEKLIKHHTPTHAHYIGSALALPGIIAKDSLATAHNLGWTNLTRREISTHLDEYTPRFIANEADLAAYRVAHPRPGVHATTPSFIYISGEVGVGAGIVLHHQQITGTNGWAGEIGHISTMPDGPQCSCGSHGCLEAFLGRRALAHRAGLPSNGTPQAVLSAAQQGDSRAQHALNDGAIALGAALAATVNILDIQHVILGGNLAELAPALIPTATTELLRLSPQARLCPPHITTIDNSSDYSVEGGAYRVLEDFTTFPASYIS